MQKTTFKAHNSIGKPLCPCCGRNPRTPSQLKCGRCEREKMPVQWDRLEARMVEVIKYMCSNRPEELAILEQNAKADLLAGMVAS